MRPATLHHRPRPGFTLIELLVVIAIIGVLMALTTAAVFKFLSKGTDLQNRSDLEQLSNALNAFKAEHRIYPPSKILISNNLADYQSTTLGKQSLQYLRQMWPRLEFSGPAGTLDWTGGNGTAIPAGGIILEGDQCLVLFLGGVPARSPNGCLGWSTSPRNPTKLGGDREKAGFEFKSSRLFLRPQVQAMNGSLVPNPGFFSYLDAYIDGPNPQPFAYFSTIDGTPNGYSDNDCQGLNVYPYYTAVTPAGVKRYLNPERFQIISAGQNNAFGALQPPATYNPAQGNAPPGGEDDMINNRRAMLGVGE